MICLWEIARSEYIPQWLWHKGWGDMRAFPLQRLGHLEVLTAPVARACFLPCYHLNNGSNMLVPLMILIKLSVISLISYLIYLHLK